MKITCRTLLDEPFWGKCVYHPKIARWPDGRLLMTFQEYLGSDYYGPVMAVESNDEGFLWKNAQPIPGLGTWELGGGLMERHCDTVPDYDPASGRMVAIGHNAYSKKDGFWDTMGYFNKGERRVDLKRRGAYCVLHEDGTWGPRHLLNPEPFSDWNCLCCGCTQKIISDKGDWLIPFGGLDDPSKHIDSVVVVCRFRFDGEKFHFVEAGEPLALNIGRGLMEPSLISFGGRILVTMRAEDERAHFAISEDGLNYGEIGTWNFDDGEPLVTSTTQQHWLIAGGRLHLVYTRNCGWNKDVFRYRAPLFISEVDTLKMQLIRSSEQMVFPFDGDPKRPESVALSGNFHVCMLPDGEALVVDGEHKPYHENPEGLALLSRIAVEE